MAYPGTAYYNAAKKLYENDDIEFFPECPIIPAKGGMFVAAFVWVDHETAKNLGHPHIGVGYCSVCQHYGQACTGKKESSHEKS